MKTTNMPYYLANYCSEGDAEAIRDDGTTRNDLAYPCGLLLLVRDEAHVQLLLDTIWEELTSFYIEDTVEPPDPDWETEGWQGDETNGSQTWWSPGMETTLILRAIIPLSPAGPE